MAMSPSPILSPTLHTNPPNMSSHKNARNASISPPPIQQAQVPSKRDKRRTMIADRLQDMTHSFSANKDSEYRSQLQAIQIDYNLISEANANGKTVLPNMGEEVDMLVRENMRKIIPNSEGLEPPMGAGKAYSRFAKICNDFVEGKDAALVTSKRDWQNRKNHLESAFSYRTHVAESEYNSLKETLRDRLINKIEQRRSKLLKEKDLIDIGTDTAMLLHPSQYSIMNPSSPGGIHGKRATRHRREADDLPTFSETPHKRKRKNHDSDESPAPARQHIDNGVHTPMHINERNALLPHNANSPLYSINELFSDKELTMAYHSATMAAYDLMVRHNASNNTNGTDTPAHNSGSTSDNEKNGVDVEADDGDSPPGAVGMERTFSHATRSTRGNIPGNFVSGYGIDILVDASYPENLASLARQIPKIPPMITTANGRVPNISRVSEATNALMGLGADEASAEVEMMKRSMQLNDAHGKGYNLDAEPPARKLLEAASRVDKGYWMKGSDKSELTNYSSIRDSGLAVDGGESMSRQSSNGRGRRGRG